MKKIFVVFGTRPECIKLAPIVKALEARVDAIAMVCNTCQHKGMTSQLMRAFQINPDYNLNVMTRDQSLTDVTVKVLKRLELILRQSQPDLVMVQGDTTTAYAASLAAFYQRIPVAHVEAGLRTYESYNPYPEEINRRMTAVLAEYHFATTENARRNLLSEGVPAVKIFVTGNTVIDSLLYSLRLIADGRITIRPKARTVAERVAGGKKLILITAHRRESFGAPLGNICRAIKKLASDYPDVLFVYPVHPNPNVRVTVMDHLRFIPNIILTDPLDYFSFTYLMKLSYLILTDSGGIQEEAPSLGKPVLVLRDCTERPEGIEAGVARLVGVREENIVAQTKRLLDDEAAYSAMATTTSPYGDGRSAARVIKAIFHNGVGVRGPADAGAV